MKLQGVVATVLEARKSETCVELVDQVRQELRQLATVVDMSSSERMRWTCCKTTADVVAGLVN